MNPIYLESESSVECFKYVYMATPLSVSCLVKMGQTVLQLAKPGCTSSHWCVKLKTAENRTF